MTPVSSYPLPFLVGNQYVLSAVLNETADTVLYAATQKDMRREVVVAQFHASIFFMHNTNPLIIKSFQT